MPRQIVKFPLKDVALRDDVHALGELLGEVLSEQGGHELFDVVEGDRQAALNRRDGDGSDEIVIRTRGREANQARDLVRAFSTWFQMVNMAEKVHRIRRRRQYINEGGGGQPGGIDEALIKLKNHGLSFEEVKKLLQEIWIEPVMTAHPTESKRRTILRKQKVVSELLLSRLDLPVNSNEARVNWERVRSEITTGWQTADNSRLKLTIADEREHVLFFVVEVIYKIIPVFYEEIEAAALRVYGDDARNFEAPEIIKFGSWVGGDMDGNPDVNAKTIRETIARQHQLIINSYFIECQQLSELLSQSISRIGVSAELQTRINTYSVMLASTHSVNVMRQDFMPYRVFLGQVGERLRASYEGRQNHYESAAEFLRDIQLVAHSLIQNKGQHAGLFHVTRLIRRIKTFGFHLVTLDLRQRSNVHRHVISQGIGDEQWGQLTASQRSNRLVDALSRDEGLSNTLDPDGKRSLSVFDTIAHCRHRHGVDAIGPFVVSGPTGADDVLSVLLLARWADCVSRQTSDVPIDVTPLFETQAELEHCGEIMSELFKMPIYQQHLIGRRNHQFVMLGYSASNKEQGSVTSQWSLRRAQEALLEAAKAAKVDLTIFHGRGNTSSRNAGLVDVLTRTMPEGMARGRVRMTEQGELLHDKYSLRPISLRVFEQSFNALSLSRAGIRAPESVSTDWRMVMDLMSRVSGEQYRTLVYDNSKFYDFFRLATPVDVIERMQIGSQGILSDAPVNITGTRPIPWSYAWAQCRYMLPAWYGAGKALEVASQQFGDELLSQMFARWYFFEQLVNQVEMGLARADLGVAAFYDQLAGKEFESVIADIRDEYESTKQQVLKLKGCAFLLDADQTIQRAIRLRNPYLDPMHLMQVDLLGRWRATDRQDQSLLQALLASVNGIGQGLQGST